MSEESILVGIGPWEGKQQSSALREDKPVLILNETAYDTEPIARLIRVAAGHHPRIDYRWKPRVHRLPMTVFRIGYFGGTKQQTNLRTTPMVKLARNPEPDYRGRLEVYDLKIVRPKLWDKYVDPAEACECALAERAPVALAGQVMLRAYHILGRHQQTDYWFRGGEAETFDILARHVESLTWGKEPSAELRAWREKNIQLARESRDKKIATNRHKSSVTSFKQERARYLKVALRARAGIRRETLALAEAREGLEEAIKAQEDFLAQGGKRGLIP